MRVDGCRRRNKEDVDHSPESPAKTKLRIRAVPRQLREERERIARDLHDDLGQTLTALKMGLEGIHATIDRGGEAEDISERLASLTRQVQGAIASLRMVIFDLRPTALERFGLPTAIQLQALAFQSRTGIPCQTSGLELTAQLRGRKATSVFRFIEEALTNVARHAAADQVRIQVTQRVGWFRLCVTDNGRGLDPARLEVGAALGLVGARERARQLGGRLEIAGVAPHGTALQLDVPV